MISGSDCGSASAGRYSELGLVRSVRRRPAVRTRYGERAGNRDEGEPGSSASARGWVGRRDHEGTGYAIQRIGRRVSGGTPPSTTVTECIEHEGLNVRQFGLHCPGLRAACCARAGCSSGIEIAVPVPAAIENLRRSSMIPTLTPQGWLTGLSHRRPHQPLEKSHCL